jgi:hypothetical protein
MKIAISGTSGYIAGNLIKRLETSGNEIVKLKREVLYDADKLRTVLAGIDVVVNLAGAPILQRWTAQNKKVILQSRAETTQNIVLAINQLAAEFRPKTLIQTSAVGIYSSGNMHDESSTDFADDFVGQVVKTWEKSSEELNRTVRKVTFRIGVVLGKDSRTIKNVLPVFKLGLGGKIGLGNQSFPFVHIDDVVGAIYWAIKNAEVHGVYNLVAPEIIDNLKFTSELASALGRPALFKVPEVALKLAYGEASSLLLTAPSVQTIRLLKYGYRFKYPDIRSALAEIVSK